MNENPKIAQAAICVRHYKKIRNPESQMYKPL